MCGIAGAFYHKKDRQVSLEMLKQMSSVITHRGPDDEGFYISEKTGFAFRRLSIIDLHTGSQPIHNEDKSVWIVFNGEIYNYIELREHLAGLGHRFYTKSDTEVIVHLYEEYGENFPLYLNGMYGIALWDEKKKALLLVRDRAGIKPLYYAETEDGILFASEIRPLLKAGVSRQADCEAINQYLSYGYIPAPLTGFAAVRKLGAGHMLVCSERACSEKQFWDLHEDNSLYFDYDEEETVDQLIDKLEAVLGRQTRSDVPLGIFLSGGIDSSLIASVAAERCSLKLDAFTIGFTEESYNELGNARVIANRLGLRLHEFILSEDEIFSQITDVMSLLEEPFYDYSAIPVYFISRLARNHVKTVVSGDGGDELFGGYQTHYLHKVTEWYQKIPQAVRSGVKAAVHMLPESHSYLSLPYKMKRFTYGAQFPYDHAHYRWKVLFDADAKRELLSSDFLHAVSSVEAYQEMEKYFDRARQQGLSMEEQLMYVDFKTFLRDDLLQKTDRMSMANSLEVRVPLLDNEIMDFSRKVPPELKVRGLQTKYLLRKALLRFQPREIAFGRKRGFTPPIAVWMKNGLKDYMLSSLSPGNLSKTGFLNHEYIAKIINDHLDGRAENSRLIWSLIVLVNWYSTYVAE